MNTVVESIPRKGPSSMPHRTTIMFCSTMGIGVPGTGIEMNAQAAVNAAKRAVNTMAFVVRLCMQFPIICLRVILDNLRLMSFSYMDG